MASKVSIYNMALSHLGVSGVTSVTQDVPATREINKFYDDVLKDVLGELNWPFATVKEALVAVEHTVMELEWEYVYVYPTQALTVWHVYDESTVDSKDSQEFEVIYDQVNARRIIGSDLVDAYVEYTYNITDTTLYSPKFVLALSYRLAATVAQALIKDAQKAVTLIQIYNSFIDEAKRISAAEKRKKPNQTSTYQQSR